MLYVESMDEIVDILKEAAFDEDSGHATYVSAETEITALLERVNALTDAKPNYIYFDNSSAGYYSLSLDYIEGELYYSICPALDTDDNTFYPDFGFCLVDECVPKEFERDYKKYGQFDENYEKPIRVYWGEEPENNELDEQCVKCDVDCDAPCCSKNNKISEKTKIDTDDDGRVWGFTKSWEDNNSHFTYSYHSTNEKDVLDLIKKFKLDF